MLQINLKIQILHFAKNIKNNTNLAEKQDIAAFNNGFNRDQQILMKVNSLSSFPERTSRQMCEEIRTAENVSNLKVQQNTQNLWGEFDAKLFQELYSKGKQGQGKLYNRKSRESSREDRAIKLQENGIKALGMKLVLSPTKIEERKSKQESLYPASKLNSNQMIANLNLQSQYIYEPEIFNSWLSPEKSSQIAKDSSLNKNEVINIFNMNLANENMADINSRRAPNFKISKMKKKRSQSENRNRNLEVRLDNDGQQDYFVNKLKSTIKLTDNREEDANFFSKRKAIQHSNSNKNLLEKEDYFKKEGSLSEKKPHTSWNLLNTNDKFNVQVPTFNLNEVYWANIKHGKFDQTWQFGGLESFNNTAHSSLFCQDECSSVGTNCDKKMSSNCNSNSDTNSIYNWTFFPKGNFIKIPFISIYWNIKTL